MAILCCVTVISRPLLGSIADHLQKLKLVMIALIFIDISADMGLNFIPPSTTDLTQSSVVCHRNVSYIFQFDPYACKKNSSFCDKCILSCDICQDDSGICLKNSLGHPETLKDGNFLNIPFECLEEAMPYCPKDKNATICNEKDSIKNSSKNPILQLCFLSIFTAIIYICNGSIVSLSDAACFNALGTRPELYGKQRLWGTIGWGSFALLAGYLNQILTGTSGKYNFSAGFYMLVLLLLTDLLVISKLKLKDVKASKNIFKDVGLLLVKPRIAIFILQVYFVGIFIGISRSYIFWYLRSLHASQLVLGCSSAVQCFLGELPFFFFAGWIISKIGHINTFTMSFVANGLKFLTYSFIKNPWLGLLIEFLQGPCFGTFYTAMTSYAKKIAPEGTEATVQGLASGTFEGLGVATGSLLGGYGFRTFGGRKTLFWTGIISFAFGVINSLINYIMIRNQSETREK
ncbi:major facilitator superfamily domain-containing protein 6-like isoform X7 [Argiope bruennichi]|nr:major facilitator superfamily domain-containing protein 6-like isoform X7 [Argiope bruennichi]